MRVCTAGGAVFDVDEEEVVVGFCMNACYCCCCFYGDDVMESTPDCSLKYYDSKVKSSREFLAKLSFVEAGYTPVYRYTNCISLIFGRYS